MIAQRRPLQGTVQILRYNWSFYVAGLLALTIGVAILELVRLPPILRALGDLAASLGAWWLLASILVSWWVYDLSPLMAWSWLSRVVPEGHPRWANLHAGLDESTSHLTRIWGEPVELLDFFDSAEMTEKSIQRARALASEPPAKGATYSSLPLGNETLELVCVIFSAHELRSPVAREAFFGELKRVLSPSGKLLVVEHVRDLANFVAFGPGFMHFMPDAEWRRLANREGLEAQQSGKITPFVRYYLWVKP